ncbi:hypothetical protein [Microbacterium sp. CFBP9034]|uniref:hypothetical protein n=1 Tax=Microbacterium sp. CFBP9034 TaxID=3096540 RepID=UPI002A69F563|nr:hypothetical protein [Microbacterium sp. CFBP9034]MDY0910031.1 hypothetical protein [Microbacterium sp. CFBP9034]
MGSKKPLLLGAAIVVVTASALLVPAIASGVTLVPTFSPTAVTDTDDGPGNNGQGNAWGHHKDSEDFPGNNGQGKDKRDKDAKADGEGEDGRGHAWGQHKDSDDFPGKNGQGKGNPHNDDSDDE